MIPKKGRALGGVFLVGGSCLGAGMLALPITTGLGGFFPSLAMFVAAWAFMTLTGLLMVEVCSWSSEKSNLISMMDLTIGFWAKTVSWILYLFLFYSLLVAYISGSGSLTSTYVQAFFSFHISPAIASFLFIILVGFIVYCGTHVVDRLNRFLMIGKIASYLGIVFLGASYINPDLLLRSEWPLSYFSLPILIVSFGYHNMIPTLMTYMDGDVKEVRRTIIRGGLLALIVYLVWEIVVLGIIPFYGTWGLLDSWNRGLQASESITGILGISLVTSFAEALAFFAIITSFLAQTLAFVHFLKDGLKHRKIPAPNFFLPALALVPPFIFALIYPQLFIKALNFAGGICAVLLFGFFPVLMVWKGRYTKNFISSYRVFGGKTLLVGVFVFALSILVFQLLTMLGHITQVV